MPKFVFVTGGVTSTLGKGITAASLGRILAARGLAVASLKMDPYLNVDPGTMSPYQHGEVFVTEDGAETDLDLGHYERFIDRNVTRASNLTTGQIYNAVIAQESSRRSRRSTRSGSFGRSASSPTSLSRGPMSRSMTTFARRSPSFAT